MEQDSWYYVSSKKNTQLYYIYTEKYGIWNSFYTYTFLQHFYLTVRIFDSLSTCFFYGCWLQQVIQNTCCFYLCFRQQPASILFTKFYFLNAFTYLPDETRFWFMIGKKVAIFELFQISFLFVSNPLVLCFKSKHVLLRIKNRFELCFELWSGKYYCWMKSL